MQHYLPVASKIHCLIGLLDVTLIVLVLFFFSFSFFFFFGGGGTSKQNVCELHSRCSPKCLIKTDGGFFVVVVFCIFYSILIQSTTTL